MTTDPIASVKALHTAGLIKLPHLILLVLSNRRGQGRAIAELAEMISAKLQSVGMATGQLLTDGMLIRHYPERDKRVTKLYLTSRGDQEATRLWEALRSFVAVEHKLRS